MEEGEVTPFVTADFLFMNMCMEWGVLHTDVERLPPYQQRRMFAFYRAKLERDRAMRQQAEMQRKLAMMNRQRNG